MLFVSYSRQDASLVRPLVRFLRATGSDVFVDVESLDYGSDWRLQLDEAIAGANRFLLFWSRAAAGSGEIEHEWRTALARDDLPIVPVLLDETPLPPDVAPFQGTNDLQGLAQTVRRMTMLLRTSLVLGAFAFVVAVSLLVPIDTGGEDPVATTTTAPPGLVTRGGETEPSPGTDEATATWTTFGLLLTTGLGLGVLAISVRRRRARTLDRWAAAALAEP